jgi:signal transduction histidine kinase
MEVKNVIIIVIVSTSAFCVALIGLLIRLTFSFQKKRILEKKAFDLDLKNKEIERISAVVLAQERERTKIAHNLHDEVGAVLAMANRNVKHLLEPLAATDSTFEELTFISELLEQSVASIRTISHGMVPHFLVKFGLVKTLQRLQEQTAHSLGNPCTFVADLPADFALEPEAEIQFYTIFLELVNNLLKHARPQAVHVALYLALDRLVVELQHDGVAISQADYEYLVTHSDGMGLESISLRLHLIAGELLYHRDTPGGKITLSMPYQSTLVS